MYLYMKRFSIIINDTPHPWNQITIYGREILQLAKIKQSTEKLIKYDNGPRRNRAGELTPDQLLHVQNDMTFEVSTIIPLWSD